jgi:hypothetical protein
MNMSSDEDDKKVEQPRKTYKANEVDDEDKK